MGAAEVGRFLSDLAVQRRVAAATQNQAFNALLFLLQELGKLGNFERAQRTERLPTMLTKTVVERVLSGMSGTHELNARD
jgi:hypothetical protein